MSRKKNALRLSVVATVSLLSLAACDKAPTQGPPNNPPVGNPPEPNVHKNPPGQPDHTGAHSNPPPPAGSSAQPSSNPPPPAAKLGFGGRATTTLSP